MENHTNKTRIVRITLMLFDIVNVFKEVQPDRGYFVTVP
jgi:hypothetical protein